MFIYKYFRKRARSGPFPFSIYFSYLRDFLRQARAVNDCILPENQTGPDRLHMIQAVGDR